MTHSTPPGSSGPPDPLFTTTDPWAPPPSPPAEPQPSWSGGAQAAPPGYPTPGTPWPSPIATLPGFPAYDPYAPAGPYTSPARPPSSPYAFGAGHPATYPYGYGYGAPYGYAHFAPPARTEGLAIASLVVSCVSVAGLCAWGVASVLGILGAILGHVARSRISKTGAGGGGMALAGIIVGWISAALGLLMVAFIIVIAVSGGFEA